MSTRLYYLWALIERFGANVLSLVGNIVLAYLLVPGDFGLMAMVSLFTGMIVVLVDAGTGDALLQLGSPTRRDFNTVFYFNVAVASLLAAIYVAIGPAVARFFNAPELREVMPALGAATVLYGLNVTQQTRLRSRLQFRKLAIINLLAVAMAIAVAIAVAMAGGGYRALVALQVAHPASVLLLLLLTSKWELRWEFDVVRFKQIWRFSANLLVSTIFNLLSQYIFPMILGWKYSATHAGYMGQAQKLLQTPLNSFEASLSITAFTLIAKEPTRERKVVRVQQIFNTMTMVNSLACVTIIALARPIVEVLFPAKWLPVIPYLQLMALWGLVYPVCSHLMLIFKVFARTSVIRNVFVVEKTLIVVAALALWRHGVATIMLVSAGISLLSLCVYLLMARGVIGGAGARGLLSTYVRNLCVAAAAMAVGYGITFAVYIIMPAGYATSVAALLLGAVPFAVLLIRKRESLLSAL